MSQEIVLASNALAARLGVEKGHMLATIKAQCFKCDPEKVSDTQLAAFVSIAHDMGVNPLLPGMLYAFPDGRGGIVPMMGPDGVMKKLAELKGVTYECTVYPEDVTLPPTHATARIYVEGKERPYTYTAVYAEWATQNWAKKPRHWNWLRALKQCARQVIHGLPMDEEEIKLDGMYNVTGTVAEETPTSHKVNRRAGASQVVTNAASSLAETATDKVTAQTIEAEIVTAEPAAAEPSDADMARAEQEAKEAAEKAAREEAEKAERKAKAKAEKAAKEKAEQEAKAKAAAAEVEKLAQQNAKPDLSKVPEICPGVGIESFNGHKWPVTLTGSIVSIEPKASGRNTFAQITVEMPQGKFDVISRSGVKQHDDGKLEITMPALRQGGLIEFSMKAVLRASKEKDEAGNAKPDMTRPPALVISDIRDAEAEVVE